MSTIANGLSVRLPDILSGWARTHAERVRLRALHREVTVLRRAHEGIERDLIERIVSHVRSAYPDVPEALHEALATLLHDLLACEGLFAAPDLDPHRARTTAEVWQLTATLNEVRGFFEDWERIAVLLEAAVTMVLDEILERLLKMPQSGAQAVTFRTSLLALLEGPAEVIEAVLSIAFAQEIEDAKLFRVLSGQLKRNLYDASGIDPDEPQRSRKSPVFPTKASHKAPQELVEAYLGGTPFEGFFKIPLPLELPLATRFEHTHIVGGTGHGKTQLLQLLLRNDLLKVKEGKGSVVVIDSQGDLIATLLHRALFSPTRTDSLAEKLVLIDPTDLAHPPALNLFDFGLKRLQGYDPLEREKLLNGAIALYEYIFGALLGAELTQKQGVIFKYLARLLLAIPGATVHTLRELMEDPAAVTPYLSQLDGTTRYFFETQFAASTFDDTRRQIQNRIWGILSSPVLERMFSHRENKVDLYDALNRGAVVVIHTAKDLLKKDGCQLLGRFFIALIAQATLERASIPPERRRSTFVYIDEAHDYFDESVEDLLNQARKYKVSMVLAHQNLDQLDERLRATVMSSTSIKLAGGVSAKDARAFAHEMRCSPEYIQDARKYAGYTTFALLVKHLTPQALHVQVPFGTLEAEPEMEEQEYRELLLQARTRMSSQEGRTAVSAVHAQRKASGGFEIAEWEGL